MYKWVIGHFLNHLLTFWDILVISRCIVEKQNLEILASPSGSNTLETLEHQAAM